MTYRIPFKVERDGSLGVKLTLDENAKEKVEEEKLSPQDSSDIPNIAKRLADGNDTQKEIAKATMLSKEGSSEGFVLLKYLTE